MGAKKDDRRIADRKLVDCIHVSDLTSLNTYTLVAKEGYIVDASSSGFLLNVQRKDLGTQELRAHLNLDPLVSQNVVLYLPQMNLDLDGTVTRATHKGKGSFEIAVQFSPDVPLYWRECLIDLLPGPGELEDEEEY